MKNYGHRSLRCRRQGNKNFDSVHESVWSMLGEEVEEAIHLRPVNI